MDIGMPNLNGIDATRRILAAHPQIAVVILSMHQDESYVLRSLKAGAKGYLLKDSLRSDVLDAIRAVSQGRSFLTRKISRMMQEDYIQEMEQRGLEDSYDLLTDREREVLQLAAEGKAQQGNRRRAEHQPDHGGDAPHPHFAETGAAQRSGADSLRRAQGHYRVSTAYAVRGCGTFGVSITCRTRPKSRENGGRAFAENRARGPNVPFGVLFRTLSFDDDVNRKRMPGYDPSRRSTNSGPVSGHRHVHDRQLNRFGMVRANVQNSGPTVGRQYRKSSFFKSRRNIFQNARLAVGNQDNGLSGSGISPIISRNPRSRC
jgi:hypothetical protein